MKEGYRKWLFYRTVATIGAGVSSLLRLYDIMPFEQGVSEAICLGSTIICGLAWVVVFVEYLRGSLRCSIQACKWWVVLTSVFMMISLVIEPIIWLAIGGDLSESVPMVDGPAHSTANMSLIFGLGVALYVPKQEEARAKAGALLMVTLWLLMNNQMVLGREESKLSILVVAIGALVVLLAEIWMAIRLAQRKVPGDDG